MGLDLNTRYARGNSLVYLVHRSFMIPHIGMVVTATITLFTNCVVARLHSFLLERKLQRPGNTFHFAHGRFSVNELTSQSRLPVYYCYDYC